jgi:hypothetical protein
MYEFNLLKNYKHIKTSEVRTGKDLNKEIDDLTFDLTHSKSKNWDISDYANSKERHDAESVYLTFYAKEWIELAD